MSLFESASLVVTPNGTKASKLYSVKPADGSGDMTVTRATTATRVNASGIIESVATNVPRLDYTGSTCPSVLIEPQRTNLLLRSEEFDNAAWAKSRVSVTSNAIISLEGTLDADKLVENTENNQHRLEQTTTSVIGTNTFSIFAKKGERDYIWLRIGTSGAFFNLTNGTIENPTGVTASIENFGNDWYRCIIVRTSTVANEIVRINLSIGTTNTYLGDGTSGVYIWGAQLEAGANATSYIPTTTASVTRNADVISKTGISSLIGQTQGTVYVEINNTLQTYLSANLIKLSSDSNNEIFIRKEGSSNTYTARFRANSINVYTNAGINVLNGNNKIAFAYKSGDLSVYLNGVQIGTSVATGSFSQLVGNLDIDSSFNDRIKSVSLWKTRLTNAELAALTTL